MDDVGATAELSPLFAADGDVYMPSAQTRGPWDPGLLHGGPVAALFATVVGSRTRAESQPARLTVDLVRPVPVAPLRLSIDLVRQGRRLEVFAAELATASDGKLVARATMSAITTSPLAEALDAEAFGGPLVPPPDAPDTTERSWGPPSSAESFVGGAMEFRFGRQLGPQHGMAWLRLWRPVLAGHEITPLARAAAAADVGNAVSASRDGDMPRISFVNADLSLSLSRPPEGEWIRLESRGRWSQNGIGWVASSMADQQGECGAVSNSLVLDAMPPGFGWPS